MKKGKRFGDDLAATLFQFPDTNSNSSLRGISRVFRIPYETVYAIFPRLIQGIRTQKLNNRGPETAEDSRKMR